MSAEADPNTGVAVYDSYSYLGASGWLQFGGTSVSSPIIASVYALAKSAGASWPNYPAALPYGDTAALYDATGGSNGSCTSVLCKGGPGWDGPTGLGTPNGLAAFGGGTTTTPTADFTSSCTNLACTFTGTSTGGSITGWSWNFGDGSNFSIAQSPSYTYGSGGTYTVTLTVTYSGSQTSIVSHVVTVSASSGTAPVINTKSCSGATCTFTATGSAPLTWVGATATVSTATGSTATKTYTSPTSYTVTVTNTAGSDSTSVSCVWNGHSHNKTLACR